MVEVDAATTTATVPQEAGTTAFYAVSAVVDGRAIMYHPLQAAVATLGSAPKLTVTAFGLGKINAGSLVDVASQGQEFVIEAEDRDQQIADIDAYGTDGASTSIRVGANTSTVTTTWWHSTTPLPGSCAGFRRVIIRRRHRHREGRGWALRHADLPRRH